MRTQCGHVDFLKREIQTKSLKRLVVRAVSYEPVCVCSHLSVLRELTGQIRQFGLLM